MQYRSNEQEISKAEVWCKETNRMVFYGVCTLIGGAVTVILCDHHDLLVKIQIVTGVIFGLVGGDMITESNFFAAKRHLEGLQKKAKTINQ